MNTVENLNRLSSCRGALAEITRLSGKKRSTIDRIRKGQVDPRIGTLQEIDAAITAYEQGARDTAPKDAA